MGEVSFTNKSERTDCAYVSEEVGCDEADVQFGSSEAYSCDLCKRLDRPVDELAEGFCVDCRDHLCMNCVRSHMMPHIVIDSKGRAFSFKKVNKDQHKTLPQEKPLAKLFSKPKILKRKRCILS